MTTKSKDNNGKPKRPISAYFLFMAERREEENKKGKIKDNKAFL